MTTTPSTNKKADFSASEIQLMLDNIDKYTEAEQAEILKLADTLLNRRRVKQCYDDLIEFCKHMQPDYKVGAHHRQLAKMLMQIAEGSKDRVCVNIPPRHGKSQLVSIYFPAWFLGRQPDKKVMMVSHTTDLAVDFGRKVRNLINTDKYREIFPTVSLSVDSKSAGRWNTNVGGEYFACLRPSCLVNTVAGKKPAGSVKPGDYLVSTTGPVQVQSVLSTSHEATTYVAGGAYSVEHPIWTMNRGWVEAGDIIPTDVLCSESILGKMGLLTWRSTNGRIRYPNVPKVGKNQESLPEPQRREVPKLWGAWDYFGPLLGGIRRFLPGYGRPAFAGAYCRSYRQRWAVQPGELPLGDTPTAAEQQAEQRADWGQDSSAACTVVGVDPRGVAVSDSTRARCVIPDQEAQSDVQGAYSPARTGWLRGCAARFVAGGRGVNRPQRPRKSYERYLACLPEAAQNLFGLFLGVRYAGRTKTVEHAPEDFVNFRVGGDNTFFSNNILTHNCGIGSSIAGRGADLLLVDDPHSEQDVINGNFEVFDKAYEWFTFGARTRLMPGGRVAIIQTRWHLDDLSGRVVRDMQQNTRADQYEVVEFPAILEINKGDKIVEKPLWPEFFDLEALKRTKASMPTFQWNAQYQQNPTSEEASLIKREWWRRWKKEDPPSCEYLIMSLDAAAETHNRADYTALTTWGVFFNEEEDAYQIILLNSIKDRFEFPELKKRAIAEYNDWQPDSFIVEKKSAGTALYQEMRRMGIPVQEYTPHRGSGDKMARLNSVADIVSSGMVWVPETRWAEEVVEEVAGFPFVSHDDLVDSTVMALMRFRQGGFIRLPSDEVDEDPIFRGNRRGAYY